MPDVRVEGRRRCREGALVRDAAAYDREIVIRARGGGECEQLLFLSGSFAAVAVTTELSRPALRVVARPRPGRRIRAATARSICARIASR
jgi:hypothetical protein